MSEHIEKLKEALHQLDPDNDEHWTGDGLPQIGIMQKLIGKSGVLRAEITEANPSLTRDNYTELYAPKPPAETTEVGVATQADVEVDVEGKVELQAAIEAEQAKLESLKLEKHETIKAIEAAEKRHAGLVAERNAKYPPMKAAEAIQSYQQSQLAQRVQRVERARAAQLALGIDAVPTGSKLDQSFSRKNQRGSERPAVRGVEHGNTAG